MLGLRLPRLLDRRGLRLWLLERRILRLPRLRLRLKLKLRLRLRPRLGLLRLRWLLRKRHDSPYDTCIRKS